jgi:dihydroorotate dehydrogenase
MYALLRKFLFYYDPESVHHKVMAIMNLAYRVPFVRYAMKKSYVSSDPTLRRTVWGIDFPNPVGLAGGFDKNGEYSDALSCLGFGFVEIGTVTPKPQSGNPQPRLFRLPQDKALLNRMGFNNKGAQFAADRLKLRKERIIIGGNIGKNKDTPNADATSDYEKCFHTLYDDVDFFIVNVSSPNTPGLRELQDKAPLTALLNHLMGLGKAKAAGRTPKPILLKIAPDLEDSQLDDIIDIVASTGIQGLVAANTTISRAGLSTQADRVAALGAGGISGQPVRKRSTEIVKYIHGKTAGKIPIIACGGIFTAEDAREKLDAGAVLVQLYTGFVYEGPGVVKAICNGLKG